MLIIFDLKKSSLNSLNTKKARNHAVFRQGIILKIVPFTTLTGRKSSLELKKCGISKKCVYLVEGFLGHFCKKKVPWKNGKNSLKTTLHC